MFLTLIGYFSAVGVLTCTGLTVLTACCVTVMVTVLPATGPQGSASTVHLTHQVGTVISVSLDTIAYPLHKTALVSLQYNLTATSPTKCLLFLVQLLFCIIVVLGIL